MIEGMGWLVGLCPQPEALSLGELCLPYGLLPSQITNLEDWEFLVQYRSLKNLQEAYQLWKQMVSNPEAGISMPSDTIDLMLELMDEAEKDYG